MPWPYKQRTKEKFDGLIFGCGDGLYLVYSGRKTLQFAIWSIRLTFIIRISVFFMFSCRVKCEIYSKLTIKTPEYITLTIKLKITTPFTSFWPLYTFWPLYATLDTFQFLLQSFYCWLWSVNCRLGLLFVVLTLCSCWNKFRQIFHLWRN